MSVPKAKKNTQTFQNNLPLDKMAAISQTISDAFFCMRSFVSWLKISLKFVPNGLELVGVNQALVQIMA